MIVKTKEEKIGLCTVGLVAKKTLDAMQEAIIEGVTTDYINYIGKSIIKKNEASFSPIEEYDFPKETLISINEEIVHGIPSSRIIKKGDIVKIDIAIKKNGFIADTARTILVEPVSEIASNLKICAMKAFRAGLEQAIVGNTIRKIGRNINRVIYEFGFTAALGIHGHGTGKKIHEDPVITNFDNGDNKKLLNGMVIAIEPMIIAGPPNTIINEENKWTVESEKKFLSSHYEHTIIINNKEPIITTL